MKKFLLLLVVTMMTLVSANAQTSLVATLSHDGNVTTFYSANALKDAYAAAVDGDIITLSSGNFTSPGTIEKNITIRGAGMFENTEYTTISDVINVDISNNVSEKTLTFEGVSTLNYVYIKKAKSPSFVKCHFERLECLDTSWDGEKLSNIRIIHCIIDDISINTSSVISNSFLKSQGLGGTSTISNCVIEFYWSSRLDIKGTITNSVLYGEKENSDYIYGDVLAKNNIYIGPSSECFKHIPGADNISMPQNTPIFKEGTTIYELTDENKAAWLGSDGTEVGMHGGSLPFDPTPSNPQVTKFNVAPKTTADGKLSVDIEVKAN